jgi:hypothetical protein
MLMLVPDQDCQHLCILYICDYLFMLILLTSSCLALCIFIPFILYFLQSGSGNMNLQNGPQSSSRGVSIFVKCLIQHEADL